MNKKKMQLGMNPSTASQRLVKDLLFAFVNKANIKCHRCGQELTRDTFSIDHIKPWLDTENPVELFFDLNNIAFSHHLCNSLDHRIVRKYSSKEEAWKANYSRNKDRILHLKRVRYHKKKVSAVE